MKTFSGRKASQSALELRSLIDLLLAEGVTRYLEIGARHGDTLHEIGRALPKGSTLVGIDLPGGAWGVGSSRDQLTRAVADLRARGQKASAIFGDSQAAGVIQMAMTRGPYDAVLIDGDHRYAGVSADWRAYGPMARIVAFHDIAGDGVIQKTSGLPIEVPALWREIKASGLRTVEFVEPGAAMGIGVVWR